MAHLWKSVDEVIHYALGEEQKAVALYRLFADQAPSAKLKALFEGLVQEEMGHFRKLVRTRRATAASLAASGLGRLPHPQGASLDASGITDVESAYRFAIRAERGAFRLYSLLAEMAGMPDVRATFEMLAREEAGHKEKLEADLQKRLDRGGFLKRLFRLVTPRR